MQNLLFGLLEGGKQALLIGPRARGAGIPGTPGNCFRWTPWTSPWTRGQGSWPSGLLSNNMHHSPSLRIRFFAGTRSACRPYTYASRGSACPRRSCHGQKKRKILPLDLQGPKLLSKATFITNSHACNWAPLGITTVIQVPRRK